MKKSISFSCRVVLTLAVLCALAPVAAAAEKWVVYDGKDGPGKGKQVVLISGDEEYRSEEGLPQLGKILAERHGFRCTVLFAIDPKDGTINPNESHNIPGLEALDSADLMIILTRFRDLPDDQMKHIVDYVESGRPVIGLRTATHAFNIGGDKTYANYSWSGPKAEGGFGRKVLGETWINHWGHHGSQSTLGIFAPGADRNPILKGIAPGSIWGPTDVYEVHIPADCKPLVLGEVLEGMKPTDKRATGKQNEPMLPVAWTREYKGAAGKTARVFATTMGAATDLESEGLRRMLVNACYWVLGMEDKIGDKTNVDLVGNYHPTKFGGGGYIKGVKPADHEMK